MDTKNIFASKTAWVNAALLGVAAFWSSISPILDPQVAIAVAAVANIVLRLVTRQPVAIVK